MSLIIYRHHPESHNPLILAANHDELNDRITLGVKVLSQNPLVIGDQDAKHGGTWLALSKSGLVVGCINIDPLLPHDTTRQSRGALVLTLAQKGSAERAAEYLAQIRLAAFNSAYLLMADRQKLFLGRVSDAAIEISEPKSTCWHILGSLGVDAKADPKTSLVRYLLHKTGISSHSEYIGQLKPILRDHTEPLRGARQIIGRQPLVTTSICYHSEKYATRSATIIRLAADGQLEYWGSNGPLCCNSMNNYSRLLA